MFECSNEMVIRRRKCWINFSQKYFVSDTDILMSGNDVHTYIFSLLNRSLVIWNLLFVVFFSFLFRCVYRLQIKLTEKNIRAHTEHFTKFGLCFCWCCCLTLYSVWRAHLNLLIFILTFPELFDFMSFFLCLFSLSLLFFAVAAAAVCTFQVNGEGAKTLNHTRVVHLIKGKKIFDFHFDLIQFNWVNSLSHLMSVVALCW